MCHTTMSLDTGIKSILAFDTGQFVFVNDTLKNGGYGFF